MIINFPIPLTDLKFKVKRTPCFGACPVYELIIDGSGQVDYLGTSNVCVVGSRMGNIDKSKILILFQQAIELGIFDLDSKYLYKSDYVINNDSIDCIAINSTCLPSITIEIRIGKKVKKIYNYQGAPKRFYDYLNLLDSLSGANIWIGDSDMI
jgi:hypothetical protein